MHCFIPHIYEHAVINSMQSLAQTLNKPQNHRYVAALMQSKSIMSNEKVIKLGRAFGDIRMILEEKEEQEKKGPFHHRPFHNVLPQRGFNMAYILKLLADYEQEQILRMVYKKSIEWNIINKAYISNRFDRGYPRFRYSLSRWLQWIPLNVWKIQKKEENKEWLIPDFEQNWIEWTETKLYLHQDVKQRLKSVAPDYDNDFALIYFTNSCVFWNTSGDEKAIRDNGEWKIKRGLSIKGDGKSITANGMEFGQLQKNGIIDIYCILKLGGSFNTTRAIIRIQPIPDRYNPFYPVFDEKKCRKWCL